MDRPDAARRVAVTQRIGHGWSPCRQHWGLHARLPGGVTTSFAPSTLSIDMPVDQDLLGTGAMPEPRLRSTGPAVFSYNRLTSWHETCDVLRRYRQDDGLRNIEKYRVGRGQMRHGCDVPGLLTRMRTGYASTHDGHAFRARAVVHPAAPEQWLPDKGLAPSPKATLDGSQGAAMGHQAGL